MMAESIPLLFSNKADLTSPSLFLGWTGHNKYVLFSVLLGRSTKVTFEGAKNEGGVRIQQNVRGSEKYSQLKRMLTTMAK